MKSGRRAVVRHLVCANRARYGPESCPQGSTGASHDLILGRVLATIADDLLADGTAERMARLAEEQAGEAQRQYDLARANLVRRLANVEAALARSQERLLAAPPDLVEDYEAGTRRLKAQRAELQAELAQTQQEAARPDFDPARFRAFWEACQKAHAIVQRGDGYPPSVRDLLAELIEGFTLSFKTVRRGKKRREVSTPDKLTVELPRWLTALASSATRT
jgi:hypothetical protein